MKANENLSGLRVSKSGELECSQRRFCAFSLSDSAVEDVLGRLVCVVGMGP